MPQKHPQKSRFRLNKSYYAYFSITLGAILLGYGLIILGIRQSVIYGKPTLPNSAQTVNSTVVSPVEKKPSEDQISSYSVPAGQPRSIKSKSAPFFGLIQKVGITKENAVGTPSNVHFGGWFVDSVLPGQKGLSIIDGHVSGKYSDGIFKNLGNSKPKDIIEIEFGNKDVKKFEVVETKKLSESKSAEFLFYKRSDIDAQLNLITCAGTFNKKTQKYADRIIVVTKLIK